MATDTTSDGLTREQINTTYEVLEVLRELHDDNDRNNLSAMLNEAHYLVQQYEQNTRWHQDFDMPDVGQVVTDPESNPTYGSREVRITDVTNQPAQTHYIERDWGKVSIATINSDEPSNAPVVKGRYVDGSDKEYAFPVTRLEF